MMNKKTKLILPKLEYRIKFKKTKNEIVQLRKREQVLDDYTLKFSDNSLTITDSTETILVTNDKKNTQTNIKKVLYTKNIERLKGNTDFRTITSWLRHPNNNNYLPSDIASSWKGQVNLVEENLNEGIEGLREPQVGAIYSTLGHWKSSDELGTIVLPTGTGKTETMLTLLVKEMCEKILIVVPSDTLRKQISDKFITLGLLKRLKVLTFGSLHPVVGILKENFKNDDDLKEFINSCNVVVSTASLLAKTFESQRDLMSSTFSNLFIDEAHHVMAPTWFKFRNKFASKKVLQFTATPYRNDNVRLDGKIIFNFPLRKAQEQGYFKRIEFIPVKKYDKEEADKEIAKAAIKKLREDLKQGYDHILLARCDSIKRADKIFKLYQSETDLHPVCIHNKTKKRSEKEKLLKLGKARIVVCVDMFGEGYDLPQLKIAAFHDARKSLPVTIQFAGRFTRSSRDNKLGNATIIANIRDTHFNNELEKLYGNDPDWNLLLPILSSNQIENESAFSEFMSGFKNLEKFKIPLQNLQPALSTVAYEKKGNVGWSPTNFEKGLTHGEQYDYVFSDINWDDKVLVIITGKKLDIDWGASNDVYEIAWELIIVHWEVKNNLLFIHGSKKEGHYKKLAKAVFDEDCRIIEGIDIYRAFHKVNRVLLQNVGLKEFLGKKIRFRMSVGADIESAMSLAEKQRGQKAFLFGVGYEKGDKISLGCSSKGRIWTRRKGNIRQFVNWTKKLSDNLADKSIDPNEILKNTLITQLRAERPKIFPVCIDWDESIYRHSESKYKFIFDATIYNISECQIDIKNPSQDDKLLFSLVTEDYEVVLELVLFKDKDDYPDFEITNTGTTQCQVEYGRQSLDIVEFFIKFPPTIWFADGSSLTGNEFVELKKIMAPYPKENIINDWDWNGVELSKESQGFGTLNKKSIQYRVSERLKKLDYDVIYNDDNTGEIADLITIKLKNDILFIELYHLKFAINGKVTQNIKNLYEVCGQTQKSIRWKHRPNKQFFDHLLRREERKNKFYSATRLVKGTVSDLEKFLELTKNQIPMEFKIYIVQPGISRKTITEEMLMLLGVTDNYLKEKGGISLKIVGNN